MYCANCAPYAQRERAEQYRLARRALLKKQPKKRDDSQTATISLADLAPITPPSLPFVDNDAIARSRRGYCSATSSYRRRVEEVSDEEQLCHQESQYNCLSQLHFKTPVERRVERQRKAGPLDRDAFYAKCDALGWRCQICGRKLTRDTVTIDHIVPLARHGRNNIENLQPLCRSCNSRKGTRSMKNLPERSLESQLRLAKSSRDSDSLEIAP